MWSAVRKLLLRKGRNVDWKPRHQQNAERSADGASAHGCSSFCFRALRVATVLLPPVSATQSLWLTKELGMSAVEFGLASQTPFLETPVHVPFEDYKRAGTLEDSEDKNYTTNEPSSEPGFESIVGRSAALRRVLQQLEVVAPT